MLLFALQNKPAYLQACKANILYIFVIFKCNFRSIWRSRGGHKHKFGCRQARYLMYKCIVACWFTLGADHLTLEGEGGVGDFWSSRIFFSSKLVGRIFFPFFPISFLLHLCCMQFFACILDPPSRMEDRLSNFESKNMNLSWERTLISVLPRYLRLGGPPGLIHWRNCCHLA